jgi:DNA-directed RNA polymerase specialized sigma24 family protein
MTETEEILSGPTVRISTFKELYEAVFPAVAQFVAKRGGSFDDARDLFQDALIIYWEKQREEELLNSSPEAYVFGISKHLWIKKFNHDKKLVQMSITEKAMQIPPDYFPTVNTYRLLSFLEQVGKKCLNLLSSFYLKEEGLSEIKKRTDSATNILHRFRSINALKNCGKW